MKKVIASFENKFMKINAFDLDEKYQLFNGKDLQVLGSLDEEYSLEEVKDKYPSLYEKIKNSKTDIKELLDDAYAITFEITPELTKLRMYLLELDEDISFDQEKFMGEICGDFQEMVHIIDLVDFRGFDDLIGSNVYTKEGAIEDVESYRKNFEEQRVHILEQIEQAIKLKLISKKNIKNIDKVVNLLKE